MGQGNFPDNSSNTCRTSNEHVIEEGLVLIWLHFPDKLSSQILQKGNPASQLHCFTADNPTDQCSAFKARKSSANRIGERSPNTRRTHILDHPECQHLHHSHSRAASAHHHNLLLRNGLHGLPLDSQSPVDSRHSCGGRALQCQQQLKLFCIVEGDSATPGG